MRQNAAYFKSYAIFIIELEIFFWKETTGTSECRANADSVLIANIDYNVRESSRARNVTLKVSRRSGLEVVVPNGFDHQLVPEILSSRSTWIDSQLERFESLPGRFELDWPPQALTLEAPGITFSVNYSETDDNKLHLSHQHDHIEVSMPAAADDEHLVQLFVRWLKGYARPHFSSVAKLLSDESGLQYKKLVVRGQKTRWGSYSSRGTLSLNYKLLFLPEHLLRHVILHELSHSVHMNHSEEFWSLLATLDENCSLNDKQLSEAWKYLPAWLD